MQIAEPLWILIGVFSCITLYFSLRLMERRREQALQQFASKNLIGELTRNVSRRKRMIKRLLLLGALFACFIALARPQYGHRWIDVKRKGIDILFALDTSASMLAEDIQPNRLQRSKYAILDFVSQLEGDRVGLMPFAGSSFLMCPLTVDYSAFEQSLQAVTTDIIPTQGTNIAQAIEQAESILENDANHKLLIIITDGENLDGDIHKAADAASSADMTIFTVGVGTTGGELIPLLQNGRHGFVKDAAGGFVTSKLDESNLQIIATKTGGLYAPLGNRGQGLETIYNEKLALIPKEELAERRQKVPIERFPWAIGAALILFICEFLLNSRKTASLSFILKQKFGLKVIAIILILSPFSLISPSLSFASPGEDAYAREDFLTASQYYQKALEDDPENVTLHYNQGTAAYKNNMYDEAIASFNKALRSDDIALQQKAYHNRGNSQYKKGEETVQSDPQKTISEWQNALESYEASLQLQPDSIETQNNYNIVEKRLKELQKQQRNQQQDDKQNSTDKDQQQQSQDSSQSGEQNDESSKQQQNDEKSAQDTTSQENRDTVDDQGDNLKNQQEKDQGASQRERQEGPADSGNNDKKQKITGELSRQEAEQLLDEIKNEEGTLNFIPKKQKQQKSTQGRNW